MNQQPFPEIPKAPRVPSFPAAIRPRPTDGEAPMVHAAKWPPDDDQLPPGSMGGASFGGGGYGGGDDGNFKKGRFKPIAIVLGVLAVGAAGAIFVIGGTKQAEQLSAKQIAEEKKAASVLPIAEAIPKWRKWATMDEAPKLQEEAFTQLAWAKDAEGLKLIMKGLESPDHRVRGTAATAILEYGTPMGDPAKPALLKALKESDASDKPQIAWALAALHEGSAFDQVMEEYRAGHLSKVQRLDGNPAFDPEQLAAMVSLDKLATLAGDKSDSVRQLVATVLSRNADAKYTSTLIKLVQDPSIEVAREAAVGLGKIANEEAMKPLLGALAKADKDSRQKFLEALRDGVGGKGLVLALQSVQKTTADTERFQTNLIFEMLEKLEDPRAGDALLAYINSNPHPHWKTQAALRMAEIGDVRCVPTLAWRMKQEPPQLYGKVPEEKRLWGDDDKERVVAARMMADLAILYPEKRAELRAQAYDGVYYWLTDKPQPHANGLRFMAAVEANEILPKMRAWAAPKEKFPEAGQQNMPPSWATAQSALRYLGWMKDQQSWPLLEQQLKRRPEKVDATMESLLQGGLAVLGMTLRAVGVGAAHGMAQWGDPKGYDPLVKYIEDKQNNEQSRIEACFSLGWVATDEQMKEIVKKVHEFDKPDPKTQLIRGCYLEALVRHPVPQATAGLVDLINDKLDLEVRHQAARAIGFGGVTPQIQQQLFDKLKDPSVRNDAALALLLGGDTDTVRRMMGTFNDVDPAAMEELKVIYNQTFGYWSDKNYENGDVARWIANAQAASRVKVRDALQDWPRLILARAIQGIDYDNGPHSVTRVQMRIRLYRDAKGADEKKRAQAITILKFMGEKGVLMALKGESGPWQEPARQAFFELMNPKATTEALPEAKDPKAAAGGGANALPPK
jgi:HEAT repeat protein